MIDLIKQIWCLKINTSVGAIISVAFSIWLMMNPGTKTMVVFCIGGVKALISDWWGLKI